MKSEIIKEPQESEQITYPILMEHLTNGYIVLFYSEREGIVVHEGEKFTFRMGQRLTWSSAMRKDIWKSFKGEIKISN